MKTRLRKQEVRHAMWRAPADTLVGYWDQNAAMRCLECVDDTWDDNERVTAEEARDHRKQFGAWPCCKLCGAEFAPESNEP